jgi:hypothetical protein
MGPGVVLAAGALVAAVVYGLRFAAREEKGRIGAGVKTASTGLLVPALALAGQAAGAGSGWCRWALRWGRWAICAWR